MPEEAVMDTGLDTGIDAAPLDTGAPEGTEPVEPGAPEGQEPQHQEPPVIDGKKLSESARQTLDKLKSENPTLARHIRAALFEQDAFRRAVPGGLKEIETMRAQIEDLGGDTGIQELSHELDGWHQFDEQFTKGDPRAIDFMLETPEGQQAFLKLAPVAFGKFQELNPEGYSAYVSQVMHSDLQAHGVPMMLERLAFYVESNNIENAKAEIGKILGYVKWNETRASKAGVAPKTETPQNDDRSRQLEERERGLTREEWKKETAKGSTAVFRSEWERLSQGRKITDTQKEAINELFESRMTRAIKAHSEKLNRYFGANDKNGFLKYATTIDKTEIPKALRAAFDAVIPARPGPRTSTPVSPIPGQPAKPAQGFRRMTQQPSTSQFDMKHPFNNTANFQAGRGILRDGTKVQWK